MAYVLHDRVFDLVDEAAELVNRLPGQSHVASALASTLGDLLDELTEAATSKQSYLLARSAVDDLQTQAGFMAYWGTLTGAQRQRVVLRLARLFAHHERWEGGRP